MTKCLETRREQCRYLPKAYRNHTPHGRCGGPRIHRFFAALALSRTIAGLSALVCPDPACRLNAMNRDVNTLFLVTIYVEAILGLLLLFAWVQNTAIYAVAWWGFADLLRAASVMLFGMY